MKLFSSVAFVLALALTGVACSTSGPTLTQDARLEVDMSHPPSDLKITKLSDSEWKKLYDDLCAKPEYQCINHPMSVNLKKKDGADYHMDLPAPTPVIQGGNVYLPAGQTFYIEADIQNGALVNMHLVDSISDPKKTLTLTLSQEAKTPKEYSMLLVVHNPFGQPLKYSAGMIVLDGPDGNIYATDTCPVMAGINGIELWPMPIFQLVLSNFRLLDAEAAKKMTCGY